MMKLESLELWEEKDLFTEHSENDKGFVCYLKGTVYDGKISLSEFSVPDSIRDTVKYELDTLCIFLQGERAEHLLRSASDMNNFCRDKMRDHIPYSFNRECWGFRAVGEEYIWYLALTPWNSKRHFSIYCYDRAKLMNALAAEKELPEYCYGVLKFTGERILIYYGMSDFEVFPQYGGNMEENRDYADEKNAELNLSVEQVAAMENGAIYGWNTPMADPHNYDENGHFFEAETEQKENTKKKY